MISEYYRPQTIQEAISLLSKNDLNAVPLGGGTLLSRFSREKMSVIDLQSLDLDKISKNDKWLKYGATATLQSVKDYEETPVCLKESLMYEGTFNIQQVATIGGTLISALGNSLFTAFFLACNAEMHWEPNSIKINFVKWYKELKSWGEGKLLVDVRFPLETNLQYEKICLTSKSKPELFVVKSIHGYINRFVLGGQSRSLFIYEKPIHEKEDGKNRIIDTAYSLFQSSRISKEYFISSVNVLLKRLDLK
jgi:CO/xanthine dehydrogenase FAD-binding subunit